MKIRPLIILLLVLPIPAIASGQTLLRWKLKAGESLNLTVQQETESQVAFGGKSATTKIDLDVELGWLVSAADQKGFKIKQTIKGVKLKLQSPQGGTIEYDSAAETRPTGQARDIADSLKSLVGAEVELTMTDRGEIVAADAASKAAEETPVAAGKAAEQTAVSRASVERLLRQAIVVLPEQPVSDGDSWSVTNQLAVAAGEFTQVKTFRLAGSAEREGQQVAEIQLTSELKAAAAAAPPAKLSPGKRPDVGKLALKEHQQSGTILFAPAGGRVTQAEQTQKLITERSYRETTIVVTLTSKQTTTVQPPSP
jgi:hypothetical protein